MAYKKSTTNIVTKANTNDVTSVEEGNLDHSKRKRQLIINIFNLDTPINNEPLSTLPMISTDIDENKKLTHLIM